MVIHCIRATISIFVLKQQQNLGRKFAASKMHLSSPLPTVAAMRGSRKFCQSGSNFDNFLLKLLRGERIKIP